MTRATLFLVRFALVGLLAWGAKSWAGTETVLHSFSGADGAEPLTGVVVDSSGNIYGSTPFGDSTFFELTPPAAGQSAWNETNLYPSIGVATGVPMANLVMDSHGALYGTTANAMAQPTSVSIFQLKPPVAGRTAWTYDTIYSCPTEPNYQTALGLAIDSDNVLYGVTYFGNGTCPATTDNGQGTIFQLTPPKGRQTSWTMSVIHQFGYQGSGQNPLGVIIGKHHVLYGTTSRGYLGTGEIFEVTPPAKGQTIWTEAEIYPYGATVLDYYFPQNNLVQDSRGALYGTTNEGGRRCPKSWNYGSVACGTVFKLTPPHAGQSSWTEEVIYSFKGEADGGMPVAGLLVDSSGALYGTTQYGGNPCHLLSTPARGCGVVFKLTPRNTARTRWTETALYDFQDNGSDGWAPMSSLAIDANGALYGTTAHGGTSGGGTVFMVTQ